MTTIYKQYITKQKQFNIFFKHGKQTVYVHNKLLSLNKELIKIQEQILIQAN